MVGFIIEIILGLIVIRLALYIFNLTDCADPFEDMFLIDTCLITGTLLLVISALPIILGLYGVIQYFIH
jgi:hypothetical protein